LHLQNVQTLRFGTKAFEGEGLSRGMIVDRVPFAERLVTESNIYDVVEWCAADVNEAQLEPS
jgi:hypothetical protein